MATINGKPVDTTLHPIVTKAFTYEVVSVPPNYEMELLGAKVTRKTFRYRKGQRVACKTWQEFKELEAKARTYGGEVHFV
jgi:hypothetical protein